MGAVVFFVEYSLDVLGGLFIFALEVASGDAFSFGFGDFCGIR